MITIRCVSRNDTRHFGEFLRCMEMIHLLARKNDVLRQTRDLLLPKLISGGLSVEVAEAELVAAGS